MESQQVTQVTLNSRYRMSFERAASSTKERTVIGYKVEVHGDDMVEVTKDAQTLKAEAERLAGATIPASPEKAGNA